MYNVLIPTDFSENAKKAARYALAVFGEDCVYTLLNTYEVPRSGATMLITIADILEKDALQLLRDERAELEDLFPAVTGRINVRSEMGMPEVVMKKLVDDSEYDLVVMGTKGATGLKSVFVGSVAANTMEAVKCPVIAVPEAASLDVPEKILFAVDDRSLEDGVFPKELAELAKRFRSEILVLNVVEEGDLAHVGSNPDNPRKPISVFDSVDHSFHYVEDKEVGHGIEEFMKNHEVDLLAMVTRKDDLFSRLFGRSVTRQMMLHSKVPLVAFH